MGENLKSRVALPLELLHLAHDLHTVIHDLFGDNEYGITSGFVEEDVCQFLEMCHQVFDNDVTPTALATSTVSGALSTASALYNDDILTPLITKFRSFFRKRFRGYTYLTMPVLREIFEQAYRETTVAHRILKWSVETTEATNDLIKQKMLQEFQWISEVNEHKRKVLLNSIKNEIIGEFEATIKSEFHDVFLDEEPACVKFYEEDQLNCRVNQLLESALEDFKQQVPYKEEPEEELKKLVTALEVELKEHGIRDLFERNSQHNKNAEAIVVRLIEHSTNIYCDKLTQFVDENPIVEPDQVLHCHVGLQSDLMQKFEFAEEECKRNPKLQCQFFNLLNESIHNSLKDVLAQSCKTGASMMNECEERCKTELDKWV